MRRRQVSGRPHCLSEIRTQSSAETMKLIRLILLVLAVAAPSRASAQTMNFEQATAILAASCGTDIDNVCRGVNLDPTRLKECLRRNDDSISPKCRTDSVRAFGAIEQRVTARATLVEAVQLGTETSVRRGPAGCRQRAAVSAGRDQESHAELQQGDHRGGVPLMWFARKRHGIGLLAAASLALALPMQSASGADARSHSEPARSAGGPGDARRYRCGRVAPAGRRSSSVEGRCDGSQAAADRTAASQAEASRFQCGVRSGYVDHQAAVLPADRTHRRCDVRSKAAALRLPGGQPHRRRRQPRRQSGAQPEAGRRDPRDSGQQLQDFSQAPARARPR